MSLILIRAENQAKLLNSLADIERHAGLKINGSPRIIKNKVADKYAKSIMKDELRSKSKIAVLISVQEDATLSILRIRKIHPPAHVVVISEEYDQWKALQKLFNTLPLFKGYYSYKKKTPKTPKV
ncbi:MAG: uncharacterized protein PWQ15_1554 [Methanobacterium sp.]|jgi:hypothetical protein|uniref:DUF356 domain-containing protein n=1 Tax=Methanobacterium sp. TaxID=2164 RepID=UPI0003C98637|nr:DUF356 domain-containing protein [Methanobacterium sp.]MDI3550451.1 uncharacterized protein [Methanobacterium sp.]CDG64617.1 hypothetical protein MBMB1_0507 [Methanobacterium sp. MB1]